MKRKPRYGDIFIYKPEYASLYLLNCEVKYLNSKEDTDEYYICQVLTGKYTGKEIGFPICHLILKTKTVWNKPHV